MRTLAFLVLLSLAAGAALAQDNTTGNTTAPSDPPAEPAGPQKVTFALVGHADDKGTYWTLEGQTARNPTLTVPPGAEVTITIKQAPSESTPHNLKVGTGPTSASISEEGDALDYTFTAPTEAGSLKYICVIHGNPMSGTLLVKVAGGDSGGAKGPQEEVGLAEGTSAVGLKDVAPDAACDLQIPEDSTKGWVGGPTLDDYASACVRTDTPEGPQPHSADLVLPLSFGAIGLGVVGMVWVHRYYRP